MILLPKSFEVQIVSDGPASLLAQKEKPFAFAGSLVPFNVERERKREGEKK